MKYIERICIVRTLKRLAQERGHFGDLFAFPDEIPSIAPTVEQQQAIIALRIDARPRQCSEAGKRLIDQLARAAVLCRHHGRSQEKVTEKLPEANAGDAHDQASNRWRSRAVAVAGGAR